MSFLAALGQYASPLLASAGGWLFRKAQPILGRIGSYFSNIFGGSEKQGLGRSVMDRLYEHGVNAAMDGVQKFAQSDFLKRKMPMLAPAIGNAADSLRDRLHSGYQQIMNGGAGGSGTTNDQPMDGIERINT